jgi:ribosomal protein L37AE/L43A
MAEEKKPRCMVCGKERELAGGICEACKAMIRGEAADKRQQIRKDAEREMKKEGVPPKK